MANHEKLPGMQRVKSSIKTAADTIVLVNLFLAKLKLKISYELSASR